MRNGRSKMHVAPREAQPSLKEMVSAPLCSSAEGAHVLSLSEARQRRFTGVRTTVKLSFSARPILRSPSPFMQRHCTAKAPHEKWRSS